MTGRGSGGNTLTSLKSGEGGEREAEEALEKLSNLAHWLLFQCGPAGGPMCAQVVHPFAQPGKGFRLH
jgi:hypothetical protein